MVKKEHHPSSSRRLPLLILMGLLIGGGGWWAWESDTWLNWKESLLQYVDNRDIMTLEVRFLPEQIVEAHRQELLENDKRTLQATILKYYPYLLLDVKYPDEQKTREGVLLWGLHDGEMVINTDSWETTHGFRDCLECRATRSDFKVLQVLARRQNFSMLTEDLQKELRVERDVLNNWIETAKEKHLIIQKGSFLQLHFENPKLLVTPQTKIKQHFVSKPRGEGQKMPRMYSRNQIMEIIQAAFGHEFKIRTEQEVFLPVYSLEILNPDGSIQVSEWNALTGQRIIPHYLSKV